MNKEEIYRNLSIHESSIRKYLNITGTSIRRKEMNIKNIL